MRAQLARVASRVEEERWAEEEEEDASWSEVGQAAKDPELREAEERRRQPRPPWPPPTPP